ncbi:uncharacterized protein LOC121861442 [Homarus americanus]|nr:uncharacterized protein LOC121861442 [Homarus americanus]
MSSESEDDFQSADEGSDFEGFEPGEPVKEALTQPQPLTPSLLPQSIPLSSDEEEADVDTFDKVDIVKEQNNKFECRQKVQDIGKSAESTDLLEKMSKEKIKQEVDNDTDTFKEVGAALSELSLNDIIPKTIENVPPKNDKTLTAGRDSPVDVQKFSELDKTNFNLEKNREEKDFHQATIVEDNVTRDADLHLSGEEETKEEDTRFMEERERGKGELIDSFSDVQEVINKTKHAEKRIDEQEKTKVDVESKKIPVEVKQIEDDVQEIEVKEIEETKQTNVNQRKKEVKKSGGSNLSNKAEEEKTTVPEKRDSGSRPIRECKIGMKKPREKLGERLGTRRIGTRVEKKTLESISSDSIIKPKDVPSEVDKSMPQKVVDKLNKSKEKEMAEKLKKQQQWEEQQQRWQQIHQHHDGRRDMSSEGGTDGWGGSWGGWGTSLLSAASTFTREVGRGVGTVMETVEGTLGVPDPVTMAQQVAEKEKMRKSEEKCLTNKVEEENQGSNEEECLNINEDGAAGKNSDGGGEGSKGVVDYSFGGLSSLGNLVSGVSGVLETASSKVLLGGLDTLEVIGRKAMDVIQEGDPGLRKKRAILSNRKPNLSLMLQEARQRAANEENEQRDGGKDSKHSQRIIFDQTWEATEGPVHLEALSLVARQCESKLGTMLQSLPHYLLEKLNATNAEIKNTCELEEDNVLEGDLAEQVTNIVPQIGLPLHFQKINKAWSSVEETASLIQEAGVVDGPTAERELYTALAALVVQMSAMAHKGAELSLITPDADPLTVAVQFKELTNVVCGGIENIADQVCGAITAGASAADPQVNNTITNIYLQTASGKNYIQQGMVLLSSVLQYANTKQMVAQLS